MAEDNGQAAGQAPNLDNGAPTGGAADNADKGQGPRADDAKHEADKAALRSEAAKHRKAASEAQSQLSEREKALEEKAKLLADKDAALAAKDAEILQFKTEKALRSAIPADAANPDAVLRLLKAEGLPLDDKGELDEKGLEKAIESLKKSVPQLFSRNPLGGDAGAGGGGGAGGSDFNNVLREAKNGRR